MVGTPAPGRRHTIAHVYKTAAVRPEVVAADAHLISSAPALLEALKPFAAIGEFLAADLWADTTPLRPMDDDGLTIYGSFTVGDFRRALAAIRQAEGGE